MRKAGNRLRISAQLIEAENGRASLGRQVRRRLRGRFRPYQITDKVVGIVEPSLQRSEIERSRRKRPDSLEAYDLYLRALSHMTSVMPADARIAAGFCKARSTSTRYVAAHALLAWRHEICFRGDGFSEANRTAGLQHARAATASGVDDATALAIGVYRPSGPLTPPRAATRSCRRALRRRCGRGLRARSPEAAVRRRRDGSRHRAGARTRSPCRP